ncbi:MAG: hypothetical protein M3Y88_04770 [Chloroflexota bacterium]|nr:hypothetical protein [Chloroflexota bacterium]
MVPAADTILYCLTRDRELAAALDTRLAGTIAFFYNDAARLHQAVMLRRPHVAVVDTDAIRPEFGDAGLGPVIHFLRARAPESEIAVRPASAADWLVGAEAGAAITMLPGELDRCVDAVAAICAAL